MGKVCEHQIGQVFSALIVRKNKLPERAPTKTRLRVLSINLQLRAWAHRRSAYAQLSPLYPSLYPYVTHVINYTRPSTAFPYCKRRKAGRGLHGNEATCVGTSTIRLRSIKPSLPFSLSLRHVVNYTRPCPAFRRLQYGKAGEGLV